MKDLGIKISDVAQTGPIELLIGVVITGMLYTGSKLVLQCGLVAVEPILGWTVTGKVMNDTPSVSFLKMVWTII